MDPITHRPYTILIVDDAPENLEVLSGVLDGDYRVKAATNGERAIKIATSESPPDLILLDVVMPVMDGFEVCRRLKEHAVARAIPIIFVTGLTDAADEERGLALGGADYIAKPVSPPIVKARVRTQLALYSYTRELQRMVETRTEELLQSRSASDRMAGELGAALRIQKGLLPDPQQVFAGETRFFVEALVEPARTVGGDFYDCFMIDDKRMFFVVGDVSGKGLPASLFMAVAKSIIKSTVLHGVVGVGDILTQANRLLARDNPEYMFVTAFAGILDAEDGAVEYCNAGHEPALVVKGGQSARMLSRPDGPALGAADDFEFPSETYQLAPGECLCIVSDGVTEALSERDDFYGHKRLYAALATPPLHLTARDVIQLVRRDVAHFVGHAIPSDDITMMALTWQG
jgi:sigma-B regulation protein RsbU (phosphoserine phosphatase)